MAYTNREYARILHPYLSPQLDVLFLLVVLLAPMGPVVCEPFLTRIVDPLFYSGLTIQLLQVDSSILISISSGSSTASKARVEKGLPFRIRAVKNSYHL
jgi:hypothetical protein